MIRKMLITICLAIGFISNSFAINKCLKDFKFPKIYEKINLDNCNLTDYDTNDLLEIINQNNDHMYGQRIINLSHNNLSENSIILIMNTMLFRNIDVSYNNLTSDGVGKIFKENNSIWELGLAGDHVTNESLKALPSNHERISILYLDLSDNLDVNDSSVKLLNEKLYIQGLNLSNTSVTDDGIATITQKLYFNNIILHGKIGTDKAFITLSKFINLQDVDLSGSNISDQGAKTFATIVMQNKHPHLNSLNIKGTKLSKEGKSALQKLQEANLLTNLIAD